MKNPISVFIMDVSSSSSENIGADMEQYLEDVVKWIKSWTSNVVNTKVKHRLGDEIIVVSEGYSTAYTIAFYISRIWKYKDNKPYFGISFGDIDKNIVEIDLEKWIHPLVKQARMANDNLKKETFNRGQFKFELDNLRNDEIEEKMIPYENNQFRYEFERLINTLLRLQYNYIVHQTKLQQLICSLYLVLMQQKKIALFLNRSPATISSHYRNGNCEEILSTFEEIQTVLLSIQRKTCFENADKAITENVELQKKIKEFIREDLETFFPL